MIYFFWTRIMAFKIVQKKLISNSFDESVKKSLQREKNKVSFPKNTWEKLWIPQNSLLLKLFF